MIDLIGPRDPWIAATAGERVLFKLLRHHHEWRDLADALAAPKVRLGRRYDNLSNFFVGASVLHLLQRLLRLAHDVREHVPNRWEQAVEIRTRICDVIQLTPLDYDSDFGVLVEEVLTAAEQMPKEPGAGLKKRVLQNNPKSCYSCGRLFGSIWEDGPEPDGLIATADHIWPRALGGDTIEENLLPACQSCNGTKGHIASWQMSWLQPVVFADIDEANGLKSLTRDIKMALHVRAAMAYAQQSGSTLKDAMLAIGPREPPVRIDPDQGYDFFNIRVHDNVRTSVDWMPN